MLVFNPPYNSLRRMGQADVVVPASMSPVLTPAQPVVVSPTPVVASAPVVVSAPYDTGVNLSAAGVVVGSVVLIALGLSVASAFARRR